MRRQVCTLLLPSILLLGAVVCNEVRAAEALVNPARQFGAMPLLVLTAGELWAAPPDLPPQSAAMFRDGISEYCAVANQLHEELAALSTRGSNRQVADSGHYIQYKRPDLVIAAIEEVVRQSRAAASAGK